MCEDETNLGEYDVHKQQVGRNLDHAHEHLVHGYRLVTIRALKNVVDEALPLHAKESWHEMKVVEPEIQQAMHDDDPGMVGSTPLDGHAVVEEHVEDLVVEVHLGDGEVFACSQQQHWPTELEHNNAPLADGKHFVR